MIQPDPTVNESKMTGEIKDIPKGPKQPFILGGTEIRKGQVGMIVVAVGVNSSYGRIMAALSTAVKDTPLQEKLGDLAGKISRIGAVVSLLLFVTLIAFFIYDTVEPRLKFADEWDKLIDIVIVCITLVVVAIPEGLPLAVILSLAYSMKQMVKDNNLVSPLVFVPIFSVC